MNGSIIKPAKTNSKTTLLKFQIFHQLVHLEEVVK